MGLLKLIRAQPAPTGARQVPIWPQFHVNQLAMHAAGVEKFQFESAPVAAAYLAGFTLLFSAVAIWRLAREG